MSSSKKPRNFIDLFAGCGGLSLGLEQAGWNPVLVNELNPDAMKTYLQNRVRLHPHLGKFNVPDVKELVKNDGQRLQSIKSGLKNELKLEIGRDLDLIVGGPPCQGFSGIGHRRSYSVYKKQLPSNHLYQDMAFVVSKLRPKMFLFENVRGLLTARWDAKGIKGEIFESILREFRDIDGYQVRWSLIYAKQYGVPQNRPRVLMVGVREDVGIKLSQHREDAILAGLVPAGGTKAPDLVDLLGDLAQANFVYGGFTRKYPKAAKTVEQEKLRAPAPWATKTTGPLALTEQDYSKHSPRIIEKFKYMLSHGGEIPIRLQTKKFAQRVLPRRWGPGGPTITATSLADDYVHFSLARTLTVREWARLQMFPDWYQFAGNRTTGGIRRAGNPREGNFEREVPKYTQIGNAVPVELARIVGSHFITLLDQAKV